MIRGAVLSDCGKFRYHLLRRWDDTLRTLVLAMLNPSTADADVDDPTIRRGIGFGRALGYGGLEVINLFAYRATKPADLRAAGYPVGPDNDGMLGLVAKGALLGRCDVCAAWGAGAAGLERAEHVRRFFRTAGVQLHCLGTTRDGHPSHPLYLPATAQLQPFQ